MSETSENRTTPRGTLVRKFFSPGNIWPGRGAQAVKQGESLLVGSFAGYLVSFADHPNRLDPTKTSTRFVGEFIVTPAKPGVQPAETNGIYLAGALSDNYRTLLEAGIKVPGFSGIPIAIEVWAEPDTVTGRESARGYSYACYNLLKQNDKSRVMQLAFDTGLMTAPRPTRAAIAQPELKPGEEIDEDTGEIIQAG